MKEFVISDKDEGKRLDKYINGILKNAPSSFVYKMLRKKNIVLNDKKAAGNELLKNGDRIKLYLSDDTFSAFSARPATHPVLDANMPPVVYEDDDVLIVDKPSGMLSQRSKASDISLNEICLSYLYERKIITDESLMSFVPSICNRLDRNTSGLITFAKTYRGAKYLSEAFRSRTIHKYYRCIVVGVINEDINLTGRLSKNRDTNKVTVDKQKGDSFINTVVHPVKTNGKLTEAEVTLITGKTHQIRAHLASESHPRLGDDKYGDRNINAIYKKRYGISSQLLVCHKLVFPDGFSLKALSGKTLSVKIPEMFTKVM